MHNLFQQAKTLIKYFIKKNFRNLFFGTDFGVLQNELSQ